jgi:hypothetical protein
VSRLVTGFHESHRSSREPNPYQFNLSSKPKVTESACMIPQPVNAGKNVTVCVQNRVQRSHTHTAADSSYSDCWALDWLDNDADSVESLCHSDSTKNSAWDEVGQGGTKWDSRNTSYMDFRKSKRA